MERLKKRFPFGRVFLIVWMLFAAFMQGATDRIFMTRASLFAILPVLTFACILIFNPSFHIQDCFRKENRASFVTSLCLTILSLLMLSIFALLKGPLFSDQGLQIIMWQFAWQRWLLLAWNYVGFLGAVVVSLFFCWYALQSYFMKERPVGQSLTSQTPFPFHIHTWTVIIAIIGLICIFSISPGYYDHSDIRDIWKTVMTNDWSDGHPISFQFFVKLFTFLIPSRRMISLVYLVAWLLISNSVIWMLEEKHKGSGSLYALLSCLWFYPLFYLQAMFKDVGYAMALLMLSAQILKLLNRETSKRSDWVIIGISSFIALSFRHDGVLPVVITFVGLAILSIARQKALRKPLLITGVAVFGIHLLITQVIAFGLLQVPRNEAYNKYGTPLTLLAAVVDSGKPIDEPDVALLEHLMPLSDWALSRDFKDIGEYTVDGPSRTWSVPGERIKRVDSKLGNQYLMLSLKYLIRYPDVELRAFFQLNSIVWEIVRPDDSASAERTFGMDIEQIKGNLDFKTEEYKLNGFADVTYRYAWFLQSIPVLREIAVRSGISLISIVFAMIVFIRKNRKQELLSFLPALGVFVSTFFGICAQDPRYILPIQEFALMITIYIWSSPSRKKVD